MQETDGKLAVLRLSSGSVSHCVRSQLGSPARNKFLPLYDAMLVLISQAGEKNGKLGVVQMSCNS